MNKVYSRINWKNYPSIDTAVNESNLNRMDYAIDEIDKRVVEHDTTKLDVETANSMVRNVSFNERSGIFTITYLNGSTKELDTKLEKIAVNFEYDADRQKLILTLIDGTYQEIDMAALITEYEFENSAYISWTVDGGKVKAEIIGGSITEDMLQPNFLADCRLYAGNAENSATLAGEYAAQSKESAESVSNVASQVDLNTEAISELNSTITPEYKTTASVTVNVASNTKTITAQLPLTKGLWYVNANARWEKGSATGFRYILVATSAESGAGQASNEATMRQLIDVMPGMATNAITQIAKGLIRLTQDSTLYMYVYQNSGSAMDVGYNMLSAYKLSENVV